MTRFLSASLQAVEPYFRLGLQSLESANGNPSHDIRLTAAVRHETRSKLLELGLDPHDTTPKELYSALQERVKSDDARLARYFQTQAATHVSAEGDVVAGMVHALQKLPESKNCFALKASCLKAVLKTSPPKRAMRALGYRSIDSMLKHEAPLLVLSAAWLSEGESWQKRLLAQYKKLQSSDFENRAIQVLHPNSRRWRQLATKTVEQKKHNLLGFKEMGALVFLPLPAKVPPGAVTVSFGLALHGLNEIRAASTFLKLCQVRADFGQVVQDITCEEPRLSSKLLDQSVPWHLVQHYYSRLKEHFREEIFEPHLQLEDMVWHPVEKTLASLQPNFNFWRNSAHLGLLDGNKPVSLNLIDTALNYCNDLPYEKRVTHYFQRSLWHELLLNYLHHKPVEDTVLAEVQPKLAMEAVKA